MPNVKPVHAGFVLDKMTVGWVFFEVVGISLSISSHRSSIFSQVCPKLYSSQLTTSLNKTHREPCVNMDSNPAFYLWISGFKFWCRRVIFWLTSVMDFLSPSRQNERKPKNRSTNIWTQNDAFLEGMDFKGILRFKRRLIPAKSSLWRGHTSIRSSWFPPWTKRTVLPSSFTLGSSVYYLQWIIGTAVERMGLYRAGIWRWGLTKHLLQVTVVFRTTVDTEVRKNSFSWKQRESFAAVRLIAPVGTSVFCD
jgi:hypothetical protein